METCEQRETRVKVMLILTSNHPEHEGQQQQEWKEYRLKIHWNQPTIPQIPQQISLLSDVNMSFQLHRRCTHRLS